MIGIFALGGVPPDEMNRLAGDLAGEMRTNSRWVVDTSVSSAVCGRVGPERPGSVWRAPDGSLEAWLDGIALTCAPDPQADRMASAAEMAHALVSRGAEALLDFQGQFCLLVLDRREERLLVATDRFGTRTTYHYAGQGRFAITSELGPLLRSNFIPRKLDRAALAAMLRFNKCRLGDRTLFEGVTVLPPATVLEFDLRSGTQRRSQTYYRHHLTSETRTDDEWLEEILPALQRAVRTSVATAGHGRAALALSGGLDSRVILAALDGDQQRALNLLSFGLPESSEVGLARDVAATVHGRYQNVDLHPADFVSCARTGVRRNEEFDIFVQGTQAPFHAAGAAVADVLISGWDLDIELRGTYLNDLKKDEGGAVDVRSTIDARWALFTRAELTSLLQPAHRRDVDEAVDDLLAVSLAAADAKDPVRVYLQFVRLFEKRRLLMLRNRMIRFELESSLPFYDSRLQTLLAGIPESQKTGDRLFAKLVRALSRALAAIPYQRTMLPADVPVEFWKRAAALEEQKEQLLREVFVATGKRIPYTRYYSNFDEWLSSDPDWLDFTATLLSSPQTRLFDIGIDPAGLGQLLIENREGVRSHRGKIVYLLSLELYLREYFG